MKKAIIIFALMAVITVSAQVNDTISYADTNDVIVYNIVGRTVFNGDFNRFDKESYSHGIYLIFFRYKHKIKKMLI